MPSAGDIVFCLTTSSTEPSYWVVREVSAVDPTGEITHVQAVDVPDSRCDVSLFVEYKSPLCQNDFLQEIARHFQEQYAGRMDKELSRPGDIDSLIDMFDRKP